MEKNLVKLSDEEILNIIMEKLDKKSDAVVDFSGTGEQAFHLIEYLQKNLPEKYNVAIPKFNGQNMIEKNKEKQDYHIIIGLKKQ